MSARLTRRELLASAVAAYGVAGHRAAARPGLQARPRPTPSQLLWQRDERALFVHVGVNTFTDREWGDGSEEPSVFAPTRLDARQWARAARAGGFRAMVLTAKHHDGFCLWPSRTTDHTVARSPWRSGDGDVVREFVQACRAEGLRAGLYLSPWDRHEPSYGDSPRYNDLYCDQLTELLGNYGPLHEVWFDGANGEGPNGRRQRYDWPRVWALVRRLQPQAVIFSDAGPDVRWIGNERGVAAQTNWSTVDPAVVPFPGATGDAVLDMLQHGDPAGTAWRPGEADVSIRPGWFYHPAEDEQVRSVEDLVQLYFSTVGRNAKLLLNVPPTREGLLHEVDVARLAAMRRRLETIFAHDLTEGARPAWRPGPGGGAVAQVELPATRRVSIADLREDVARGQAMARYLLEGADGSAWRVLARGTTIGHRKLDRFEGTPVRRVRLTIQESVATPGPVSIALYG